MHIPSTMTSVGHLEFLPRKRGGGWRAMPSTHWLIALTYLCITVSSAAALEPPRPSHDDVSENPPRKFAQGVWIDWRQATVELDARVVLRTGPLELLACSPRTREHESILVVPARPMHVFQALGLVGLEAGSPLRYDEERGRRQNCIIGQHDLFGYRQEAQEAEHEVPDKVAVQCEV